MPPVPKAVRIRTASGWQDIAMGAQGPTGPTGPTGPQGSPRWQSAWSSSTIYAPGEAVSYQGQSWVANQNTTGVNQYPGSAFNTWDLMAAKGVKGDEGGNAPIPIEAWKTLPLSAGWSQQDAAGHPAQYRKWPDGRVEVRGFVTSGTNWSPGVNFATLPVGYWPTVHDPIFPAASMSGGSLQGHIQVQVGKADGKMYLGPQGGPANPMLWISLDGIAFDSGQTTMLSGPKGDPGAPGPGVLGAEIAHWTSGSTVAMGAGTHVFIPVGLTADSQNTAGLVRQSDGSVLITSAGWYQVGGNYLGAGAPGASFMEFRICISTDGSTPAAGGQIYVEDAGVVAGEWPHMVLTAPPTWLPAGARVGFTAYCSVAYAAGMNMNRVGIQRCGGAVGPKGDPGGASNSIAQTYTIQAAYTKDRVFYPGGATTMNEIAIVLATLIDDMKAAGLITGP